MEKRPEKILIAVVLVTVVILVEIVVVPVEADI